MKRKSYVGRMMQDVLKQWNWYLASTLGAVGYLLTDLYVRNMTGVVTDAVLARSARFLPLLAAMLLAYLGESPFHGIATYTKAMMSQRVMRDLRIRMGEKVMRISLPSLAGERTGDLVSRIGSEMETLDDFVYFGLSFVTTLIVQGIASFAVLFSADWQLTCVLLAGAAVCLSVSYRLTKSVQRRELAARRALGRAAQSAQQGFLARELVKSFAVERPVQDQYRQSVNEAAEQEVRIARFSAWVGAAGQLLGLLPLVLMLILGAFRIYSGTLTPGTLLSLSMVGSAFCGFLQDAPENIVYLRTAAASCERIYSFLDLPEEAAGKRKQPAEAAPAETVAMAGVTYRYGERTALDHFALTVPKGSVVALVGGSGSGKSTALRLICGFLTADEGTVRLFGSPAEEWDVASLRQRIGVVFQESYLFPGTLRENLRTAKEDASDEEMLEACRRAGVSRLLLDRGLEAQVGERGGQLSGGERQRIAIARAFLKDAPLLLLDEPTSALDAESERLVLAGLRELMKDRTTVLATHRLNLAAEADRILVLEDGRVIQEGTHAELLRRREGVYARMVREQALLERGEAS